jgi:hypothetical protein
MWVLTGSEGEGCGLRSMEPFSRGKGRACFGRGSREGPKKQLWETRPCNSKANFVLFKILPMFIFIPRKEKVLSPYLLFLRAS